MLTKPAADDVVPPNATIAGAEALGVLNRQ